MDTADFKSPSPETKLFHFAFFLLPFALLLFSGCVAYQVAGEVQQGRRALLRGDPPAALTHFQRAAKLNPDYVFNVSALRQGVWTFVGRAYYTLGNLPEAHEALEQARSRDEHDYLAKLYLGLTLARMSDRQNGLRETTSGLKGLGSWLDHIQRYHPDGDFWDPTHRLTSKIDESLAMIEGKEMPWSELIANGEWLGKEFDEEIEEVKREKFDERHRDGDKRNRFKSPHRMD